MARAERGTLPRVVVDPAVPAHDRALIAYVNPTDRDEEPPRPGAPIRWEPGTVADFVWTLPIWTSGAFGLIGTVGFMAAHGSTNPFGLWLLPNLSGALKLLGLAHDAVLAVALLAVVIPALCVLAAVATSAKFGQDPVREIWRRHHNRYVTVGELDQPARALLRRAQRAIDDILHSEIHHSGVLDKAQNEIVLPQHEWEIAQALRVETRFRERQPDIDTDRAASAQRVEALEKYAAAVRAADAAYVLDRGAGDQLGESELSNLTLHARAAESVYQDTLRSLKA